MSSCTIGSLNKLCGRSLPQLYYLKMMLLNIHLLYTLNKLKLASEYNYLKQTPNSFTRFFLNLITFLVFNDVDVSYAETFLKKKMVYTNVSNEWKILVYRDQTGKLEPHTKLSHFHQLLYNVNKYINNYTVCYNYYIIFI